ncbi:hypothetical protein Q1695_011662 [Nippostrongylus brasiliensis]|nr:hypothetical protein Q1695_011662 [Nippostrongylus brasiliensis]
MPVSSSDGRRKRSATNESSSCESKRHRDSPSEVVTSSEERRDLDVNPESGMAAAADMEVMDVPDEAEGDDDIEVLEEGQEDSVQHVELLSDEDVSEQSMDDFDEDEDDGGMESDEEIDNGDSADVVILSDGEDDGEEIGGVEMEDDHGDDELEDGDGLVVGQDDEALAADDNSLDAPAHSGDFIDDEDREAASAVEEADDEGRTDTGNSSSAGTSTIRHTSASALSTSSAGGSSQPPTARLRIPIVYGTEDQCSSSNESGAAQFAGRRRRPISIYQPGARHAAASSAHQDAPPERLSARMRGRARAALRGRGKGRGSMH